MRRQKKDAATFVRDQRIAKIGAAEIVEAHADGVGDDETIDAAGPAIMPGIVDCHVHPWYGGITSFEELDFRPGVAYRARRATHGPKQVLRAGAQQSPRLAESGISMWRDAAPSTPARSKAHGSRPAGTIYRLEVGIGSPWRPRLEHPKSSFSVPCNTRHAFIKRARREITHRARRGPSANGSCTPCRRQGPPRRPLATLRG